MGSSSGASSESSQLQHSGSEEDLRQIMDQRKRKRMLSNRESARRSRMRKQKHLDDMMAQMVHLRKENNRILTTMNVTTQFHMNVEAENAILRAQMAELTLRLQTLNEIMDYLNSSNVPFGTEYQGTQIADECFMNIPWVPPFINQPIMASADGMFMYWNS